MFLRSKIQAFTVLEITIVLALTSLLSALFFGALNRFNVTVANEMKIKNELNAFFLFRSNLWRELDEADSIVTLKNTAILYSGGQAVKYIVQDQKLSRQKKGELFSFDLEMNEIGERIEKGRSMVCFNINWKNEELLIKYPMKKDVRSEINSYFNLQKWK